MKKMFVVFTAMNPRNHQKVENNGLDVVAIMLDGPMSFVQQLKMTCFIDLIHFKIINVIYILLYCYTWIVIFCCLNLFIQVQVF